MNRQSTIVFVLFAVFAFALVLVSMSNYQTTFLLQQRIAQLERDSDSRESGVAGINDKMAELQGKIEDVQNAMQTATTTSDEHDKAIQDIASDLAQLGLQTHTIRERLCEKMGGSKTSGLVCPTITRGQKVIQIGNK